MGVNRMLRTPCTILRDTPEGEDEFGNPASGKPEEVETVCAFQQRRRDEHEEGGELSDTLWTLYLPPETALDSGDSVEVNGRTYEVVGEPWDAQEGSRSMWHVEATCRRTAGTGDADA